MLVTEPSPRLVEIAREAAAGGADLVQLRDKRPNANGLRMTFKALSQALRADTPVVVNADWQRAAGFGARHIHLPERSAPPGVVRFRVGAGSLLGKSVHSTEAAQKAAGQGVDYLIAGTIFASASHPGEAPAGLDFLRDVCAAVAVPVLAIGGVTPENAPDCLRAGAAGVAVLSPIMRAEDPQAVARRYRAALDAAWAETRTPSAQ
jgi:thiamine-phosphate diphosphorylase